MSTTEKPDAYAAYRAIPIESLLTPFAARRDPHQSRAGSEYYHTSLGKLQVTTLPGAQLFRFWSGSHAGVGGRGAIDFVIKTGLAHDLRSASDYLQAYVGQAPQRPPSLIGRAQAAAKKPYQAPRPIYNAAENQRVLAAYLCGQRKLPTNLIQELGQEPHAPIRAGYGTVYGHYIVFPLRDHTDPGKREVGAILRWQDDGPPTIFDGQKAPKVAGTDSSKGWWQVGPYPASTLIVVEAPIDAVSLWAAMKPADRATTRILATGGTGFPTAPGLFTGVERLIAAQDRDAEGCQQAQTTAARAQAAGLAVPVIRLEPPKPAKDWNEVWMASPDVVRRAVQQALHPDREHALSR